MNEEIHKTPRGRKPKPGSAAYLRRYHPEPSQKNFEQTTITVLAVSNGEKNDDEGELN